MIIPLVFCAESSVLHTIYLRKWTKNGVTSDEVRYFLTLPRQSLSKVRKFLTSSSATPFLVALSSVNCAQTSDSDVLENKVDVKSVFTSASSLR